MDSPYVQFYQVAVSYQGERSADCHLGEIRGEIRGRFPINEFRLTLIPVLTCITEPYPFAPGLPVVLSLGTAFAPD